MMAFEITCLEYDTLESMIYKLLCVYNNLQLVTKNILLILVNAQ